MRDVLQRPSLATELTSGATAALIRCEEATTKLNEILSKIKEMEPEPQSALRKLKAQLKVHGRKLSYPFKEKTIQSLQKNVETCETVLQSAMAILDMNIGTTTHERLSDLDSRISNESQSLKNALDNLHVSFASSQSAMLSEMQKHISLAQTSSTQSIPETQKAAATLHERHDRLESMLKTVEEEQRAQKIIDGLKDAVLRSRRLNVVEAAEKTFEWILRDPTREFFEYWDMESTPYYTSTLSLRTAPDFAKWLRERNGIFWIYGKLGFGKSTLMKFVIDHERTDELLGQWAHGMGHNDVLVAEHFFWIAGSELQKSM